MTRPVDGEGPLVFDRTSLLGLAAWVGLALGLVEAAVRSAHVYLASRQDSFDAHIVLSRDVVWMAPLAEALLVGTVGLLLVALGRIWPRVASARVIVFILAFLALLGPLWSVKRLNLLAATLLAAGLAVQSTRLAMPRAPSVGRLVRRTGPWLVAIVVGLTITLTAWQTLAERRALAALPAPDPGAPNVLLVVLDTVRAANTSLDGYARSTTLHLERLARGGAVFEHALATSPWTLQSHASMFTGRYPQEFSASWETPLDGTFTTLAEAFSADGYATAGLVANLLYCTSYTGLAGGFLHYADYPVTLGAVVKNSWLARRGHELLWPDDGRRPELLKKSAADVNHGFLRWLDGVRPRPFFAFLNYFDAHVPYVAPPPWNERFGPALPRVAPMAKRVRTAAEIQVLVDAYDGAIAHLDDNQGLLLDELGRRDLLRNTLVIVTSDHGELFGEHGLFAHANSLYWPLLHVPLVVSFPPRIPAGIRVSTPVTLRDLAATIIDLVPLRHGQGFPGTSLAGHWAAGVAPAAPPSPVFSHVRKGIRTGAWLPVSKGDMPSLVAEGKHYIVNGDGDEDLYDLVSGPGETRDLADILEARHVLERFRASLRTLSPGARLLGRAGDPTHGAAEVAFR